MSKLAIKVAEQQLLRAAVKHSSWHDGAGCRFRVFQVPNDFDLSSLPNCFEVIFNIGTDLVIREWQDYDPTKLSKYRAD